MHHPRLINLRVFLWGLNETTWKITSYICSCCVLFVSVKSLCPLVGSHGRQFFAGSSKRSQIFWFCSEPECDWFEVCPHQETHLYPRRIGTRRQRTMSLVCREIWWMVQTATVDQIIHMDSQRPTHHVNAAWFNFLNLSSNNKTTAESCCVMVTTSGLF